MFPRLHRIALDGFDLSGERTRVGHRYQNAAITIIYRSVCQPVMGNIAIWGMRAWFLKRRFGSDG